MRAPGLDKDCKAPFGSLIDILSVLHLFFSLHLSPVSCLRFYLSPASFMCLQFESCTEVKPESVIQLS